MQRSSQRLIDKKKSSGAIQRGGDDVTLLLKSKLEPVTTDEDEEVDARRNGNSVNGAAGAAIKQDLSKDYGNIALLLLLYFLQGIPLGLTGSLPFILTSRKVSYKDQGTFSFALWPFSLKLLWAPIVDSMFIQRFGRRKSWLIPIQYMIGIFLILFADFTMELLEGKSTVAEIHNHIYVLTGIFFMFTFLAATQDIVVDGWALTMLSKENVSWGSTANTVGQTAGWFVGNVLFLTIESADFSNNYIRPFFGLEKQTYGVCTLDKFMYFFGIVFLVTTTLVMLFKHEKDNSEQPESKKSREKKSFEENLTVTGTYKMMWRILWLEPIKKLVIILMTVKIGFAVESMSYMKLIEFGVPKEKLGLLAVPLTPIQLILPLYLSRYTNGPKPFDLYIKSIPFRLAAGIIVALWIYATPMFKDPVTEQFPFYFYMICVLVNSIQSVFTYSMFVSQMAFFAKISDKAIGGTYMTFLNTITNMGGNWPSTSALYLASYITVKQCAEKPGQIGSLNSTMIEQISSNKCSGETESKTCESLGGVCNTEVDAFFWLTTFCTVFGIVWYFCFKRQMNKLQNSPQQAYKILKKDL